MVPSILNDSTTFSLDFEGSVLPETSKIEKKCIWKFLVLLIVKKNSQDLFFQILGSVLGSVWESLLEPGVNFGFSFGARGCKNMWHKVIYFCFFSGRGLFSIRARFLSPKPSVLRWCFSKSSVSFESETKSTPNMLNKVPKMMSFLVWVWNPCETLPKTSSSCARSPVQWIPGSPHGSAARPQGLRIMGIDIVWYHLIKFDMILQINHI